MIPSITVTERFTPPAWALLQRHLFDVLDDAAKEFAARYARADGTLIWRTQWPGMDGSDDPYEGFMNFALLYALGGNQAVLDQARVLWDGITWQWTEYGQIHDEFDAYYDWMHHGEAYLFQYFMGLADPASLKQRQRAVKFAELYTTDRAGNYDPHLRLIRSPVTGSRGPRHLQTAEDWSTHREILDNYLPPFEDIPGTDPHSMTCNWSDDTTYAEILARINARQARGDVPLNLGATSMATHAYMHTGAADFRDWVLDYTAAWKDRTDRNGGITPDNIGLSGLIGEYNDGKWWGGYYGWRWPHGAFSILEPLCIAATNAVLLTGDQSHLDLPRSQLDMLWALRREEGGKTLVPNRHYDAGWCDWREMHPMYGVYLWMMSLAPEDAERAERGWSSAFDTINTGFSGYGKNIGGHMGFNGNTAQWFAWIRGRNAAYPEQLLQGTLDTVAAQIARFRAAENDPLTMDHYRESMTIHMWQELTPVLCEALVQLTMGAPAHVYHGGLQHASLRWFDAGTQAGAGAGDGTVAGTASQGRPGLPPGVAALVHGIDARGISVTLSNTDPGRSRVVIAQAGSFGEHDFTAVTLDGARTPVNGRWLRIELAPGAMAELRLDMARFVNRPSYATPFAPLLPSDEGRLSGRQADGATS